ncbi:MAG: Aspartate aminotransferase, partial [Parcubacteria group bacterium GW2011_GWB1_38_8]
GECFEDEEMYRTQLMVNRDLTAQRLSEIPNVSLTKPGGAFYCFPDISYYGTSQEVADRLNLKQEKLKTSHKKN